MKMAEIVKKRWSREQDKYFVPVIEVVKRRGQTLLAASSLSPTGCQPWDPGRLSP